MSDADPRINGTGPRIRRSWWLEQALDGEVDAPALAGELVADVCIVGAGYAGLWTALQLKAADPSLSVVILEADVAGFGASGRNGGMALTFWHHFIALQRLFGTDEALRLARASEEAVAEIGLFCARHGVDAQYRNDGWLWSATNPSQRGAWQHTVAALESVGECPFAELGSPEVSALSGSAHHLGGVFEQSAATIQPALLVRGLRRVAIAEGVTLREHSPMVAVERGKMLAVRTPRGRVRASKVVLTMNAWLSTVRELRNAFAVVASDLVMTAPIPERLAEVGWNGGLGISDSRLMVHYYRPTPDGRVAFGKGGCALGSRWHVDSSLTRRRSGRLAQRMREVYPAFGDVRIDASWSGPIDRPIDGLPFFTALGRPDLICGGGFSGNGVGPTVLAGKILASMVLERDDQWSRCGLVRTPPRGLPPEPVRYLGGRLVRSAVARKERAEDAGRAPLALDKRLAGLAPTGLVPLD